MGCFYYVVQHSGRIVEENAEERRSWKIGSGAVECSRYGMTIALKNSQ